MAFLSNLLLATLAARHLGFTLVATTILPQYFTTLALPVDAYNSVKLYASSGVSARTGNNFDALGVAWQYRWGGGNAGVHR